MNALERRIVELQRSRVEADPAAMIDALFCRCPALWGFSVQDAESLAREGIAPRSKADLFLTEVSVYPWSDLQVSREMCGEIVNALRELIDERLEALELLHERTFARALH